MTHMRQTPPFLHSQTSGYQTSNILVYYKHWQKEKREIVTLPLLLPSFSSIDASEAQSVPGFVCFISAKDVPGSNITGTANDETVFAEDVVRG